LSWRSVNGLHRKSVRAFFRSLPPLSLCRQAPETTNINTLAFDRNQLLDAFYAVHFRHGQIHGDDIRLCAKEHFDCGTAIAGGADHLEASDLLRTFDAPPDDVGIIDDHELQGSFGADRGIHQAASVFPARLAGGMLIVSRVNFPGTVGHGNLPADLLHESGH